MKTHYKTSLTAIAKGGGISLAGTLIGMVIGYFFIIVASKLGPSDYGLLSLASAITSFAVIFALLGLDQGLLRYIPYYEGKKDTKKIKGAILSTVKICIFTSLFLFIITFIFSNQIATLIFHKPLLSPILKVFSFTIPLLALASLFTSSLRAFRKVEYDVSIRIIAEKSIRLLSFIILFFLGFSVLGISFSYLISAAGLFLLSFYFLNKIFPLFKKSPKTISLGKELLSYSSPLLFSGVLLAFIAWIDLIMIGYFKTSVDVGIYNAALPTASLMFIIPSAITALFLPVITNLYGKNRQKDLKKVYKKTSKWVFLTNFPIVLIMFVFSDKIINIIFGQQYLAGSTALSVLAVGYLFYTIAYTSSNILSMMKKTKLILFITLIFASSSIILNYLLIPRYGVNGASIATSSAFLTAGTIYILSSYRYMKLHPFSIDYMKIFLVGVLSMLAVYGFRKFLPADIGLFTTFFLFAIFILIYISFVLLMKIIDKEDWEIINLFKDKIRIISNFIIRN